MEKQIDNPLFDEFIKDVSEINKSLDQLVTKYQLTSGCIRADWLFEQFHIKINPLTLFNNSEKFQDYSLHIHPIEPH